MKKNITIGIEGLVGSGKTSICRELLDMVPNSIVLHGGNLYRGIVVALMNSKIDIKLMMQKDPKKNIDIKQIMDGLKVELRLENRESVVYVDNRKIEEEELQSDKASMAVSSVALNADNSKFYTFGKHIIDEFKKNYNVIVSGRDLMKIYPNLDYHFFITASLESRVERKAKQYKNDKELTIKDLEKHIQKRDELQEKAGYYEKYANTIDIDTTECKTVKESAEKVFEFIKVGI